MEDFLEGLREGNLEVLLAGNSQGVSDDRKTAGEHGQNGYQWVQDPGYGQRNADGIIKEGEAKVLADRPYRQTG